MSNRYRSVVLPIVAILGVGLLITLKLGLDEDPDLPSIPRKFESEVESSTALFDGYPVETKPDILVSAESRTDSVSDDFFDRFVKIRNMEESSEKEQAIRDLFLDWGRVDGETAVNFAYKFEPNGMSSRTIKPAFEGWGQVDPESAWHWISSNLETFPFNMGDLVDSSYSAVLSTWLENRQFTQALDRVLALPSEFGQRFSFPPSMEIQEGQAFLASEVAEAWAEYDYDAALNWFNSLPENIPYEVERAAMNSIVGVWAMEDPRTVAEWAITLPESKRSDAITIAVNAWLIVADDINVVGSWLNQLPSAPEFDDAFANFSVEAAFKNVDIDTSISWMDAISDREFRNRTIATIAHSWDVVEGDFRKALQWMEHYEEYDDAASSEKLEKTAEVYLNWAEKDPEGAKDHLENHSTLTESQKIDLLSYFTELAAPSHNN